MLKRTRCLTSYTGTTNINSKEFLLIIANNTVTSTDELMDKRIYALKIDFNMRTMITAFT